MSGLQGGSTVGPILGRADTTMHIGVGRLVVDVVLSTPIRRRFDRSSVGKQSVASACSGTRHATDRWNLPTIRTSQRSSRNSGMAPGSSSLCQVRDPRSFRPLGKAVCRSVDAIALVSSKSDTIVGVTDPFRGGGTSMEFEDAVQ